MGAMKNPLLIQLASTDMYLFVLQFRRITRQKGYDVGARLIVGRVVTLEEGVKIFAPLPAGTTLDQLRQGFPRVAKDAAVFDESGAPLDRGLVLRVGRSSRQREGQDDQKQRKARHSDPSHW